MCRVLQLWSKQLYREHGRQLHPNIHQNASAEYWDLAIKNVFIITKNKVYIYMIAFHRIISYSLILMMKSSFVEPSSLHGCKNTRVMFKECLGKKETQYIYFRFGCISLKITKYPNINLGWMDKRKNLYD